MSGAFQEADLNMPNLQDFKSVIYLNTQKSSFYSVVYFGIIIQLTRLKGMHVARKTLNELNKALDKAQEVEYEEYYKYLKDFMQYTETAPSLDIKNHLIATNVEEIFDRCLRKIISTTLRNESKTQYANEVSYGKEVLKEEEYIFNALTKILKITLSIYTYESPIPFIARSPNPNPEMNINLLYNQNNQNSWYLLIHNTEYRLDVYGQTVDKDDLPFTYINHRSLPALTPITKIEAAQVQPINDYSHLLDILTQIIITNVGWISESTQTQLNQEISKLNPQIPNSKTLEKLQDWSTKQILKCSHNSSNLIYFIPCHKVHCKLCMQEQIDLLGRSKKNFSCPCGLKVPKKYRDKHFTFPGIPAERIKLKLQGNSLAASSLSTQESTVAQPVQEMCETCMKMDSKKYIKIFSCRHKICKRCYNMCNRTCYKCVNCEICQFPLITKQGVFIHQNHNYHYECTTCQICGQSIFNSGSPAIQNGKGIHLECQRGSLPF